MDKEATKKWGDRPEVQPSNPSADKPAPKTPPGK